MQAATSQLRSPRLGPVAAHDVLPFNAEPVIIHDLHLRDQGARVGLDSLVEIRAGVQPSDEGETDLDINVVQWRGLCRVVNQAQALHVDGSLSPLSEDGTQLVKALAKARGLELEATFVVSIRGNAARFRWDYNSTPPSMLLYSLNTRRGRQVFRIRSLDAPTLQACLRSLQANSVVTWLRLDKSKNANRSIASIVGRFREEYPRGRAHEERDSKRHAQNHHSHVMASFITPVSIGRFRKIMRKENLIAKEDIDEISRDILLLTDAGHIYEAEEVALPFNQPDAAPPSDMEARTSAGQLDSVDEYLDRIPLHFFDHFDLPTAGSTWRCGIGGCQQTYQTPSNEVYPGTDEYDREALYLLQCISKHRLEHLDQPPLNRHAQSTKKAILALYKLEESSS